MPAVLNAPSRIHRFAASLGLAPIPRLTTTVLNKPIRARTVSAKRTSKQPPIDFESRIIRPQATYRWLFNQISTLTPQLIEQILRGALAGSHIQAWQLFWLMEDSWPRLRKNLNEVKAAVQQLDWQLHPWQEEDTPPTKQALERVKVVSNACWKMHPDPANVDNGFLQTQYDIMDAWGKGSSILEIEWEVRKAGSLGDIVAPKSTIWVHPTCYAWSSTGRIGLNANLLNRVDTAGKQLTYDYDTSISPIAGPVVDFPPDKFIVAFNRSSTGSPLGCGRLRALAWWWCACNFSASWMMNHAQIFGLPIRWATYPTGADDGTVNKINNALDGMGHAAWASFPEGVLINLEDMGKSGPNSPNESLQDKADKNCDLLILGQTLTSEQGHRGSQALGRVHEGVKDEVVQSAASFCAEVINKQLNEPILRLTYGEDEPDDVPEWRPTQHEEKDKSQMATWMVQMAGIGMQFPSDWTAKQFDVPIPGPDEDVLEAPKSQPMPAKTEDGNPDDTGPANAGIAYFDENGMVLTAGDVEGHPFHGNQYATVAGGKTEYHYTSASDNMSVLRQMDKKTRAEAFAHANHLKSIGHTDVKVTRRYVDHTIPGKGIGGTTFYTVHHGNPPKSEEDLTKEKKGVKGKATAPESKLERNSLHPLAHAVASDLAPVGQRLRDILSIGDDEIFVHKMKQFMASLDKLAADIGKDPKSAHELMQIIASAMAHGLIEKRKVVK